MARIKCYFIEPTEFFRKGTRRYSYQENVQVKCPAVAEEWSVHRASLILESQLDFTGRETPSSGNASDPEHKEQYPTKCEKCDYIFVPEDEYMLDYSRLYKRTDDGRLTTLNDAEPGAMWYAPWYEGMFRCPESDPTHVLVVLTPGGHWVVDSRASNCTRKDDNTHFCWLRSGDPKTGNITVHKNGDTCTAGAGSILIDSYHAMLQDGYLIDC